MFKEFATAVEARFKEMSEGELFVVESADIFDVYINAFPEGTNPLFRKRTEHDCNCCKQFIRRLGVVVSVKNNEVHTVWGVKNLPHPYNVVAEALDTYVKSANIVSVFRTKEIKYGTDHNYDNVTKQRYDHLYGTVERKHYTTDADTKRGEQAAIFQVLDRGLIQIKQSDIESVLDLIASNSLYRGEEHKPAILGFQELLKSYEQAANKRLFVWENLSNRNARFRNTVIGTLLVDLANGEDIETAVKSFETKVAPQNYKRTTSIITQRMVEEAVEKLNTLGLGGAIYRRYARISDMSATDVLFVNNDTRGKMKDSISHLLKDSVQPKKPDLKNAVQISAENFVKDVLPGSTDVQIFLENRHTGNFVSLTGSDGPERLFKWNNNFAWSYDGDVTDSVKQRVKAAGGNIHADLRVSLSWFNFDDLDLHAMTPYGHVYYGQACGASRLNVTRILDVDMNAGRGTTRTPVENLAFMNPREGSYKVFVNQFAKRESDNVGFAIEIENNGELRTFSHGITISTGHNVECFTFEVKGGRATNFKSPLKEGSTSQDKWGVKTESLVPVNAIMYSPNHWGDNRVGAKHLIFALEGCKNPDPTRGVYNEYLKSELEPHRKVFEVLASKTKCKPTDDQVSGVGFTAARGDTVTVVVDGRSYVLSF